MEFALSFGFIDCTFLFTCFWQEKEHWMNLCEAISDHCYIIGDNVCHRPGLFKDECLADDFQMSAVTFRLEEMTTVTDILTCVTQLDGMSHVCPLFNFCHRIEPANLAQETMHFIMSFI